MSAPLMRRLTPEEARRELYTLERNVDGGIENFEERARYYDLSPREQAVWERIRELRWLLDG